MPVVWLPEADAELKADLLYYAEIRPALGQRFANAVVDTVNEIAAGPLHYAVVQEGRRRAGVRKFPYGLYFVVEQTRIVVIACFHGYRLPRHWQTR